MIVGEKSDHDVGITLHVILKVNKSYRSVLFLVRILDQDADHGKYLQFVFSKSISALSISLKSRQRELCKLCKGLWSSVLGFYPPMINLFIQ